MASDYTAMNRDPWIPATILPEAACWNPIHNVPQSRAKGWLRLRIGWTETAGQPFLQLCGRTVRTAVGGCWPHMYEPATCT